MILDDEFLFRREIAVGLSDDASVGGARLFREGKLVPSRNLVIATQRECTDRRELRPPKASYLADGTFRNHGV
jgi:hypothetical protein